MIIIYKNMERKQCINTMENLDIKLEKENNDYFREWIIEEWKHHNTVDPIYQLRIIKPEELTFEENEEYYKIMCKNEMVGFIGIKNYEKEICPSSRSLI